MRPKTIFLTRNGLMEPLGQSQVLRYIEGLSNQFNVSIISFEKKQDLIDADLFHQVNTLCLESKINWIPNLFSNNYRFLSSLHDLILMIWLSHKEIKKGASLIHARSYIPAFAALIISKFHKVGFIFDMRALWPEELITAKRIKRGSLIHKLLIYIERVTISHANSIITLTNASVGYLNKQYPMELTDKYFDVIPTCADLNKFKLKKEANKNIIIGCSGTLLSGWFDIKKLALFYAYIAKRNQKINFEITTKENQSQIEAILREYNVPINRLNIFSAKVNEMPRVNQDQTASVMFYKGGELSELGRSPTRMAEVLGSGNPVIANSGVGDVDNTINQYQVGVLLDDIDSKSLEQAYQSLMLLLEDPNLSMRCRHAAEKIYSLSNGIESYQEIYKRILKIN